MMHRFVLFLTVLCLCDIITSRSTSSESGDEHGHHKHAGYHRKHKYHKHHKHRKDAKRHKMRADPGRVAPGVPPPNEGSAPGQQMDPLRVRNELFNPYQHQGSNEIMTALLIGNVTQHTMNTPYVGVLLVYDRRWCGCSLVDMDWALTAAHCLNYVLPVAAPVSLGDRVQTRFGSIHTFKEGELVPVEAVVRHPKFEEEPAPHADVALLKLSRKLVLTPTINIIKLYDGVQEPFAQSYVFMSGWGAGRADFGFTDPVPDLASVRMKVRTKQFCRDSFQTVNGFEFTDDFFCAAFRHGDRDVCRFDAGIGAVQQNMLMGVLSFGPERCGLHYEPVVFVKTFYFKDFVMTTLRNDKSAADVQKALIDMNLPYPLPTADPMSKVAVSSEVDENEMKLRASDSSCDTECEE